MFLYRIFDIIHNPSPDPPFPFPILDPFPDRPFFTNPLID